MYRIGIDAGSKTIKLVVIDESGNVLHSLYRRHGSNIKRMLLQVIEEYLDHFGNAVGPVAVTGSAGISVAEALDLPFVQEVVATTDAVRQEYPQASAVIELGGEDAKVIYLDDPIEQRMNATCAGGTGGFIDTFASMMGIRVSEVNLYALRAKHVYPISYRCAVFAQSDVRPLLAAGVSKEDMAASVLEAVVKQTIGGLACGRPIRGNVVFLGGPLEFIPDLYRRFCLALELDRETGIKPHRANLFTARGAAIGAGRIAQAEREQTGKQASNEMSVLQLRKLVLDMDDIPDDLGRMVPLFENDVQRADFEVRHAGCKVPRAVVSGASDVYLGLDVGSTTVKYALVDGDGRMLASASREAAGDALLVASRMLEGLYTMLERTGAHLVKTVITGSGSEIPEAGLKADARVSDMTAVLTAVQSMYPQASFVLDVGGQDMKAMWIKDGAMADTVLNDPCSSGCGAFLADAALSMGVSLEAFDELALEAQNPVELDTKCTVFMTSRVRHAQKAGASDADIAAGIACSIARNALHRVIGRSGSLKMGECAVVAGGAFRSKAVLRAFEQAVGREVICCDSPHMLAALGAALVARSTAHEALDGSGVLQSSSLIGAEQLSQFDPVYSAYGCESCEKKCMLSLVDFGDGRVFVSGNHCADGPKAVKEAISAIGEDEYLGTTSLLPRSHNGAKPKGNGDIGFGIQIPGFLKSFSGGMVGGGGSAVQKGSIYYEEAAKRTDAQVSSSTRNTRAENTSAPNIMAYERELLAAFGSRAGVGVRSKVKIGIVSTLAGYEQLPFWHTLFTKLGYSVVVSDESTSCDLKTMSAESIPSESACEAAKITHERVYDLARQGAHAVFMPRFVRKSSCPVVCDYADAIADNVPFIADGFVKLVSPRLEELDVVQLADNAADAQGLLEALAQATEQFAPGEDEIKRALAAASEAQQAFADSLAQATRDAFEWLHQDASRRGVVVAGRSYQVDAELAHDVDNQLQKLGMAVFGSLGLDEMLNRANASDSVRARTPHRLRLERYARVVASDEQLDLVMLVSFGCGYDAMNTETVKELLAHAKKMATVLKIDDMVDPEHIAVRLAMLAESACSAKREPGSLEDAQAKPLKNNAGKGSRVTLLTKGVSRQDLEMAQSCVPQDLCSTAAAVIAQAVNVMHENPETAELMVPTVCHTCLVDTMSEVLEREFGKVPAIKSDAVYAPPRCKNDVELTNASAGAGARTSARRVKIGIIGNPLLCFDACMNENVGELIESLGAEPVFASPELLDTDDVRYMEQLALFSKQGVSAVLYLQSFGCLKGHAHGRGALHEMRRRFPNMPVTVLDYDPQSSALNRENRIRLVVATAIRRVQEGPKFGSLPQRFRRASCIEILDKWPFYHNTRSINMEAVRNPYGAGAAGTPDYEVLKEASDRDRKVTPEMAAAIRAVMLRGR